MRRTIFVYGLPTAALVFVLKMIEYKMFVRDIATDTAIGIIALLFLVLGVGVGIRPTSKKDTSVTPGQQPSLASPSAWA